MSKKLIPKKKETKQAILIDGMHLCYRHFHAQKNNDNAYKDDVFVGFYHGMFSTLKFIKSRYPQHEIYMLWDSSIRRRDVLFPDYKKRATKDSEADKEKIAERKHINALIPDLKKMLTLDGVNQCIAEGYEADDVAGFMVNRMKDKYKDVILWTGDLDWAQLIQKNVRWVNSNKNNLIFTHSSFYTAYGYPPQGIPVYKCLTGDKSDNIKGVYKFLKKNAVKLANRTTSIEGIYYDRKILHDLSDKWREELMNNADHLRLNYQLVTLFTNITNLNYTAGKPDQDALDIYFEKFSINQKTRSKKDDFFRRMKSEKAKKATQADESV